ncbi:acyltransferase domain-containing protein [Kitasatospora sp. NBC_01250]|uniref:ACP S-malonyltransferase n=1 Tax=Kitasatospora sp. NBC_01250 TaxID=2903571 RepID=UPI002E34D9AE|nr:acyltransferase domain-containing protein [Kitasatospora sp. NBC_01250]
MTGGERRRVLLFPGIGAVVPGSLGDCADPRAARALLERAAAPLPPATADALAQLLLAGRVSPAQDGLIDQLACYVQALAWHQVTPCPPGTLLLGHSLGELAAFAAAGVFEPADGVRLLLACDRARRETGVGQGRLLVLRLAADRAAGLLAASRLPGLAVACDNAPEQTVVSGPPASIEALGARAAAAGVRATRLPTRTLFHNPALRPAAHRVAELTAHLAYRPARRPVLCMLTGRRYRSAAGFRAGATHHLTEPVPFRRRIEQLRAAGVVELTELGPRTLLSRAAALTALTGGRPKE